MPTGPITINGVTINGVDIAADVMINFARNVGKTQAVFSADIMRKFLESEFYVEPDWNEHLNSIRKHP
jgi:hypothetical protein